MKLLNNKNCEGGVQFIGGDKGFMQRDTYIELQNIPNFCSNLQWLSPL